MSALKRPRAAGLPPIPGFQKNGVQDTVALDSDELLRMERLYATESTVQACSRVLQASVLGNGLRLLRNGATVELKAAFLDHLNNHWLAFARAAIDSVLTHGFVAVVLCQAPAPPFGAKTKPHEDENVIPCVADFSTCRVEMRRKGPLTREYQLVLMDGTEVDKSMVFVKTPPNHEGVASSPLQSIKDPLVFMHRLVEYAMQADAVTTRRAEAVASRQQIVTQPVPRLAKQNANLDTDNMFFDSGALPDPSPQTGKSRGYHKDAESEKDAEHQRSLLLAGRLAGELNRVQTTRVGDANGATPGAAKLTNVSEPPAVPPSLFVCPENQEISPAVRAPTARSDLEALQRQTDTRVAIAMGVPAVMMSEGSRFASSGTAQLRSFNAHVAALASFVSTVLSAAYTEVYGGDGSNRLTGGADRLVVMPTLVRDLKDVMSAATSGILSVDAVAPLVMQSLGFTQEEIEKEEERRAETAAIAAAAGVPAAAPTHERTALAMAPPSPQHSESSA